MLFYHFLSTACEALQAYAHDLRDYDIHPEEGSYVVERTPGWFGTKEKKFQAFVEPEPLKLFNRKDEIRKIIFVDRPVTVLDFLKFRLAVLGLLTRVEETKSTRKRRYEFATDLNRFAWAVYDCNENLNLKELLEMLRDIVYKFENRKFEEAEEELEMLMEILRIKHC